MPYRKMAEAMYIMTNSEFEIYQFSLRVYIVELH